MSKNEAFSELEKDLVVAFNENTNMKNAVIKALTHSIYELGTIKKNRDIKAIETNWILSCTPDFNSTIPDATPEEVGKKVMNIANGLRQLNNAIHYLDEFSKAETTEEKPKGNPAV